MRTRNALLVALVAPLPMIALLACKKPPPPVPDAAPVVTAEPPEAAPLVAMEPDAGDDGAADAGPPKKPGVYVDPKVARIKQCCNALRAQGKTAPEIMLAAGQCDAIAAQAGAKGTAPELGFLRTIKTIPPLCQGL